MSIHVEAVILNLVAKGQFFDWQLLFRSAGEICGKGAQL
jgi:hypothetical protein